MTTAAPDKVQRLAGAGAEPEEVLDQLPEPQPTR